MVLPLGKKDVALFFSDEQLRGKNATKIQKMSNSFPEITISQFTVFRFRGNLRKQMRNKSRTCQINFQK